MREPATSNGRGAGGTDCGEDAERRAKEECTAQRNSPLCSGPSQSPSLVSVRIAVFPDDGLKRCNALRFVAFQPLSDRSCEVRPRSRGCLPTAVTTHNLAPSCQPKMPTGSAGEAQASLPCLRAPLASPTITTPFGADSLEESGTTARKVSRTSREKTASYEARRGDARIDPAGGG